MRRLTKIAKKILVVCTFFVPVLLVNSVSAISSEEIFTKVLLNNVNKCYEHALINEIDFGSYTGFDSLMNPGYKQASSSEGASSPTAKESPVFYIPAINDDYNNITEVYGLSGGRVASCYALFYGDSWGAGFDGTMKGLFEIYNKKYDTFNNKAQDVGIDKMNDFMGGLMKYTIKTEEVSKTEYCYTVYVKEKTLAADPVRLGSACINEDNYPLENDSGISFTGGRGDTGYSLDIGWRDSNNDIYISEYGFYAVVTSENDMCDVSINYHGGGKERCQAFVDLGKEKPTVGRINLVPGEFPSRGKQYSLSWPESEMPDIYVDIEERTSSGDGSKNISYEKPGNSARMFIKGLLENSDLGSIEFTDAEKYDLYLQYLKNYYGKKDTPISSNKCQPNRPSPIGYYIFSKGKGWCLANVDEYKINDKNKMTVFSNRVADPEANYRLTIVIDTLPELINLMAGLDYSDESAFTDIDDAGQSEGGIVNKPEDDGEADICYSKAGVLGWIVCPIIHGLVDVGSEAYNWIAENFLQVRSEIFTDNESNGVLSAWDTIRNIANIGFVILLLVVIISQLTGFGIDNYGIKRILPKLIVGAILMNLSYVICELLVDASNIVGSGIDNAITSMSPEIAVDVESYTPSGFQTTSIFGGGAIALGLGLILSNGIVGAVLLVLVALIVVVVAILVLFITLIVRQAGIVACVIIAPIAVVCYLLPNTEKFFKKWVSLMKGLLLIYPLCGLVIGVGKFMGRIFGNLSVGASGNAQIGFALSAMIVTAVPYLFIPTLLKSSLSAMGNLGAKISGLGSRLRSGASRGIRNSDAMKASRQRAAESRTMRRAGYSEKRGGLTTRGRIKAKFAKTKIASALGYTRMQNARIQAAEKISDTNKEARAALSSETAAADIAEYLANNPRKNTKDYFQEQIDNNNGDVRKLDAAILTAQKRGLKNKDIADMIMKAQNKGKLDFAGDGIAKTNWLNSMLKNHGDIMSTSYDLQEWARDGGKEALGDYGDYVATHRTISDIDINDLSKMSGDSLAGAIKAGLVTSSMAQQWLASNPNQSADKKVMMGAVASGLVDAASLSGITANEFKKEAQAILEGRTSSTTAIIDGAATRKPGENLSDLVDSWTATSQARVYISQDSSAMKDGQKQRDPVRVILDQSSNGIFDVRNGGTLQQDQSQSNGQSQPPSANPPAGNQP